MPAALLIFVAQAYFLAAMDPWTPLAAALLAGAANLAGDVALVCWLGWGIAGAALATAAAQVQLNSGTWSAPMAPTVMKLHPLHALYSGNKQGGSALANRCGAQLSALATLDIARLAVAAKLSVCKEARSDGRWAACGSC